jgi:hypothetical protein
MDEIKTKQQVVEKIKNSSKILVTVSDSPTVDALSAALALTLLLDKQEKYATAIFSGQTPPAIAFLQPEKTFDETTDSLRDFIIALNKEKADHLRYKVEGDAVRIFITPYKTTISQDDLEFSQGDYNVELVIALGVDNPDHLDGALENHGQILHDAAIITVTNGDTTSDLGGIDWHDTQSSSLSEMVAGLAEALKEDKKKTLLDESIATALLTGIVAETDRFSNEHTTSKAMTVAAQLMSAGADQQLISTELQKSQEPEAPVDDDTSDEDDSDDSSSSGTTTSEQNDDGMISIKKDGLSISHAGETLADLDKRVLGEEKAKEKVEEEIEAIVEEAKIEAEKPTVPQKPAIQAQQEVLLQGAAVAGSAYALDDADEPSFGGTLNATTEQAADDARRAAENDQNKTILSHAYLSTEPNAAPSAPAEPSASTLVGFPGTPDVAPGSVGVNTVSESTSLSSAYAFDEPAAGTPSSETAESTPDAGFIVGGEKVIQPLTPPIVEAPAPQQGIPMPPAPNPTPTDLGLPLPPPLPDFSQGAPVAPAIPLPPTQQPPILGDILTQDPAAPLPPAQPVDAYAFDAPVAPVMPPVVPPAQPPTSNDPGEFKIPGQA